MSSESAAAVVAIALLLVVAAWAIPIYRRVQHWMEVRPKRGPSVDLAEIRDQICKLQELSRDSQVTAVRLHEEQISALGKNGNAVDPTPEHLDRIEKQLAIMDGRLAEFLAGQRQVLRAMYGTGGTEDDDLVEMARNLQVQYPGLSLEDAIARARTLKTYSPR